MTSASHTCQDEQSTDVSTGDTAYVGVQCKGEHLTTDVVSFTQAIDFGIFYDHSYFFTSKNSSTTYIPTN